MVFKISYNGYFVIEKLVLKERKWHRKRLKAYLTSACWLVVEELFVHSVTRLSGVDLVVLLPVQSDLASPDHPQLESPAAPSLHPLQKY